METIEERELDRIIEEKTRKRQNKQNKKQRKNIWKKLLIIISIIIIIAASTMAFLLYGPYSGFREWLITCSMTTMTHQWIAKLFYSDETIAEVMSKNRVNEIREDTDTSSINTKAEPSEREYTNEYEKQILAKDLDKDKYDIYADEEEYRIINIKGDGYTGFLAAVYDPSKIQTLVTSKLGKCGEYLTTMAKNNNAVLAINGGRFSDPAYSSNGGNPRGVTYSKGKCMTSHSYKSTGGIVGFNKDNILVLSSNCTKAQAESLNIRDCVTCGPFLIVNGKASEVLGNGGWGTAPRTAIGQRKDGVVLMLVLDGRTFARPGADMDDLIEIMQNYGAYNAANLDGGTSSVMAVDGELINDPIDSTGQHKTRFIATGFGLIK
ncbi:MAG: phosphodiester glycosidase family protein [Clostridia bacterium]|nr:phosphodiester glycosidase family protein [Clostridia bacterium]